MKPKLLFGDRRYIGQDVNLEQIISDLKEKRNFIHSISVNDLLDYFDNVVRYWQESKALDKVFFSKNLVDFFKRSNLESSLKLALRGDVRVLDTFCDLGESKFLYHAQPRGLIVQWLAGNVPILGLFSILTSTITKNVCIAKASSKGYHDLIFMLETLSRVKTKKVDGSKISETIAVVLIDNSDRESHEILSKNADVRVAWGGEEAIKIIEGLPKTSYCEDIIFGPKYSYAVVDNEILSVGLTSIARSLAVDVSVFDQYACSSPHTVFVQETKKVSAIQFAKELAKQLEFVNSRLLPKGRVDPAKAYEIISLRNEYAISGQVLCPRSTDWTVIYTKDKGLAHGSSSRVVVVKPLNDLTKLRQFNDRQKQTLGVAMSKKNKLSLLDEITLYGIDRCPDIGYMTFYESPWDGMFVFDRLVRWITMHK